MARKLEKPRGRIETYFESGLWNTRFVVVLAVVFGLLGALALFLTASYMIFDVIRSSVAEFAVSGFVHGLMKKVLIGVIGAVDLYLIGVVTLIFSFGMYELFISRVEESKHDRHVNALSVHSLDQLKNNIVKVVVIVLVVTFFEGVLVMEYRTPLDMMYLAISISVICLGLYFLHRKDKKED